MEKQNKIKHAKKGNDIGFLEKLWRYVTTLGFQFEG